MLSEKTNWIIVVIIIICSTIPVTLLNALGDKLQSEPTRTPGLNDMRYWKEIPVELVPNALLFISTLAIPFVILMVGVFGARKLDVLLKGDSKELPFRGHLLSNYYLTYWATTTITYALKQASHQLRPLSITECKIVLGHHNHNVTQYTASLAEIKLCCSYDNNLCQGYPSGHASMSIYGVFGFGVLLVTTPWLLDGLAYAFSCGKCTTCNDTIGKIGMTVIKGE